MRELYPDSRRLSGRVRGCLWNFKCTPSRQTAQAGPVITGLVVLLLLVGDFRLQYTRYVLCVVPFGWLDRCPVMVGSSHSLYGQARASKEEPAG